MAVAEADAEAKRLRKAAKRAAAEAEAAEAAAVELKQLRKAAKRATKALAAAEADEDVDPAELKRLKKEAKRAANALSAADDAVDEAAEVDAAPKAKKAKTAQDSEPSTPGAAPGELTVFVGGIPFRTDEKTLKAAFAECGPIKQLTLPLNGNKMPAGYAFITFETEAAVQAALKWNGEWYEGRTLKVTVAGADGQRGKARGDPAFEVFVKGLTNDAQDSQVRDVFEECGEIHSLRLPRWEDGGAKGMAFITFADNAGLEKALAKSGLEWGSRTLLVQRASQGKGGGKGKK